MAAIPIDEIGSFPLMLGRSGENNVTEIKIDCSTWLADYPDAIFAVFVKKPGRSVIYSPSNVAMAGNILRWTVTSADTSVTGNGNVEIRMYSGDKVKKSATSKTTILDSLVGSEVQPTQDNISWMDTAMEAEAERVAAENTREGRLGSVEGAVSDHASQLAAIAAEFEAAAGALTEDSEVILARGGKPTLNARLDGIDSNVDSKAVYAENPSNAHDSLMFYTYDVDTFAPRIYVSQNGINLYKACDVGKISGRNNFDFAPKYINGYWYIVYDCIDSSYNDYETYNAVHPVGGNRIYIAKTSDFVTFNEWEIQVPAAYKARWAPELFVDDDGSVKLFVTMSKCDETRTRHTGAVVWKKYCYIIAFDDDTLTTCGAPTLVSLTDGAGVDVSGKIDPFVYRYNGYYYLFIKDEDNDYIQQYKSSILSNGYALIKTFTDLYLEGASVVSYGNTFLLYAEMFHPKPYGYYVVYASADMETWGNYNRLVLDDDTYIKHFTPVLIDTVEKKQMLSNLIHKGGTNPFKPPISVMEKVISGTYPVFTLKPGMVYEVANNDIASIDFVDTSLMKTGDSCYILFKTASVTASVTLKYNVACKLYWNALIDLILNNRTGARYRLYEIFCVTDGCCYFKNLNPNLLWEQYLDASYGLKLELSSVGRSVQAKLYGTLTNPIPANTEVTVGVTVAANARPALAVCAGAAVLYGGNTVPVGMKISTAGIVKLFSGAALTVGTAVDISTAYVI